MQLIIFLMIWLLFFLVCKRNYKNRANNINNNFLESIDYVVTKYNELNKNDQDKFMNSLKPDEKDFLTSLLNRSLNYNNSNINRLQHEVFILEDIMKKIKTL